MYFIVLFDFVSVTPLASPNPDTSSATFPPILNTSSEPLNLNHVPVTSCQIPAEILPLDLRVSPSKQTPVSPVSNLPSGETIQQVGGLP